eukprot:1328419-Amorphochlora_amoeboformis.AAC.5
MSAAKAKRTAYVVKLDRCFWPLQGLHPDGDGGQAFRTGAFPARKPQYPLIFKVSGNYLSPR